MRLSSPILAKIEIMFLFDQDHEEVQPRATRKRDMHIIIVCQQQQIQQEEERQKEVYLYTLL